MKMKTSRAGTFVPQPGGYTAFVPDPLPPDPPIQLNDFELLELLSRADRALGRLDGATEILPNPDLFVDMYVRQEAILSSQIEGTQASLIDVLEYELEGDSKRFSGDTQEVANYVRAMNYGLARLEDIPLCLRLIREIHHLLLDGTRGCERDPGQFRKTQNWIGPPGVGIRDAIFVPPPVPEMLKALDDLERFVNSDDHMPILVKCALAHAQFETIHPFLDGNGRLGRLLITFMLCERQVLRRPLLYLSLFLKRNRSEYYDKLNAVRTHGDFEGWIKFFLRGVAEISLEATETARAILELREEHRTLLTANGFATANHMNLLEHLYEYPIISVKKAVDLLDVAFATANDTIARFVKLGLLQEITGKQRGRLFAYVPYLQIFTEAGVRLDRADSALASD